MSVNLFNKPAFTGLKLCKLIGISHNQFQSFKKADLIENKHRYSLQEVLYIAFTNYFRELGYSWKTILRFYNDGCGGCVSVRNADFLNCSTIVMFIKKEEVIKMLFLPTKNPNQEEITYIEFVEGLEEMKRTFYQEHHKYTKDKSTPLAMTACQFGVNSVTINIFYVSKIIEKIIQNSRELNLKVNIEEVLLFNTEGKELIG